MSILTLDVRVGESLKIGEATVKVVSKSGQLARLEIEADKSVQVRRIPLDAGINAAAERGIAVTA